MTHLYPDDEPYDQRDENYVSSDEDRSYYCEVCDKEFATDQLLVGHKASHKLCGIDGCGFSAHPLLVERHIKMQHSSGLYHRMKNLSTPEDIEKWIQERKRKYPTKANIELKKVQEVKKKERGEIINENRAVTRTKSNKTLNSQDRKRKARKRRHKLNTEISFYKNEVYRGICTFPGLTYLTQLDEQNVDDDVDGKLCEITAISDEEDVPQLRNSSAVTESHVPNLVANYGSDSEQDEGPEEVPIKKMILESNSERTEDSISVNQNVIGNSEARQSDVSQQRLDNDKPSRQQNKDQISKGEDSRRSKYINKYNVNRLQLLNKLLSRSIQHERNLICQCLKYIVDNNYFT